PTRGRRPARSRGPPGVGRGSRPDRGGLSKPAGGAGRRPHDARDARVDQAADGPAGVSGMELRPRVAITLGDAAGIGPEITVKSLADHAVTARAIPLVLGDARVLERALDAAGHRYEGQTEILGELTGSRPAMLLLLGKMRLMLFTNHMALRAVCDYVRQDRVLDRLALADAALRDLGIARPRLAVAGLNPHAGEEGAFGHEERDEIVPAIAAARARGIDAQGPFPADTGFLGARDGAFGLTLALYHDQGLM